MDFTKYPLERFFYCVAGVIPGFVALFIFQLATAKSFSWFFASDFLGYRTKLSLIVIVAFLVGNSLTAFLSSFLGMIGRACGGVTSMRPYKPPPSFAVAPWRDRRWRNVLKRRLGTQVPNDSNFITQELFDLRSKGIDLLPEEQRFAALAGLRSEKMNADMDDWKWADWYEQYHQVVLQLNSTDPAVHVQRGLHFNLETTALYVLISAAFVPSLRHWWCILPSCVWVLLLVAQEYSAVARFENKWSTLFAQTEYLDGAGAS